VIRYDSFFALYFYNMIRNLLLLSFFYVLLSPCEAQVKNPFSIERAEDDTLQVVQSPKVGGANKIDGENPFNVSHIPIRQNQFEEIERLKISDRVVEENISFSYFPLWIIILSLCLLAGMLFLKRDHLATISRCILNDNFMRMTSYSENGGRSAPYIIGYLLFLINIALFLYLYVTKTISSLDFSRFLMILGFVAILKLGKHLLNALMGWALNVSKTAQLYDFTIISVYNIISVVFIILNVILVFGRETWIKPIAVIATFIYITSLLSRHYKGLRISQKYINQHFFHFFLYFCAFEISPWVILYTLGRDYL